MDTSMGSNHATGSDDSGPMLAHVGRTLWDNVPFSLFASVLLLIAAAPASLVATSISPVIAWPLLVLCTGPVWAGTMAASGRLLEGDAVTLPVLLTLIRRHAWAVIRISVVPAIVGIILLGSLQVIDRNPDATWIVIPLLLDLGVAVVVGIALVPIFTLVTGRGLTGTDAWLAAAGIAIARPVPVLGTLTLFGLATWAAVIFGPVAVLVLGPFALLCSAVTHEALPDPGR